MNDEELLNLISNAREAIDEFVRMVRQKDFGGLKKFIETYNGDPLTW